MKKLLLIMLFLSTFASFSQGKVTGKIIDAQSGQPLSGANVVETGTSNGTIADFDGNFTINVKSNSGTLTFSFVGFLETTASYTLNNGIANVGQISMTTDTDALEEVVITASGVVDIAKDRETPVAVSTIRSEEIQEKLGSQEFPEILNNTPSIYATKQGGGFGDARINIRGFDTQNSAVLINGIPVNDMENGIVYWSNWAGLSDVASAIQVQRGLGSSKLTVSSVGGTINVITRSADRQEGGFFSGTVGNNNYIKNVASYSTGLSENGWSGSFLFSRTEGDGYVDGTEFEAYNYYIGVGYKPNDSHSFEFTLTGAPQQHNQRGFAPAISDYIQYGSNGEPRIKYNSDWGLRNGREFTFAGNFYHKPLASLNWEWDLSENSKISTSAYASFGRGGSVGSIGRINRNQSFALPKTENGLVPVDAIIAYNSGGFVPELGGVRFGYSGGGGAFQGQFVNGNNSSSQFVSDSGFINGRQNGISQRSSVNSHNWYGLISNFETNLNENLTMDFGIDLRSYTGFHYRRLVDLLGADVYVDSDNINNPYRFLTETYEPTVGNTFNVFKSIDDEEKIDYYNDGNVSWLGAFGQLEYSNETISGFVQGAISNQGFQRVDYFNYLDSDPEQESKTENILGGNIKGGVNFNIDEKNNIFANAGYYSKQPLFDAVFPSFVSNEINENLVNEKIIGTEIGYGFRTRGFRANLNLYRTSWDDRFSTISQNIDVNGTPEDSNDDIRGTANIQGIKQVHMGAEFDFTARINDVLSFNGMVSYGDWRYDGNVSAAFFDESNQPILENGQPSVGTLYLDDIKVGDAAQFTASLGTSVNILKNLKVDANYRFADKLYAEINAEDFDTPDNNGSLELPSFGLLDAGLSFSVPFMERYKTLDFRLNINNVLDKTYISESDTNFFAQPGDPTYDGIATSNRVFFGFGTTWNASVRLNF
ncbi:TonB-dependent receptor [Aequorivita echinoideorum]|uniref:Carboxypeptidase-like regulatory domain-containing protein n=1 Tax=Aequorivita echinoideorum TaxID=1549647 RepID=A0ABS5S1X9_9FLAO|nr:carboxypeptidase-like regulatory domain-containing protein [Aequorivita echinoideorum]MBT0606993.1 carboxypeptidase-like regulatory domain-containing protein [Aequorivita echinoideorum]